MFLKRDGLHKLPHLPGVYIYRSRVQTVLYVGKARDLSKRVKGYFVGNDAVGDKTRLLVSQIATIEVRLTPTEFDALLLEAELIRKFLPKYNVIARDDKSPLYVTITNEMLPRILQLRKTQLPKLRSSPRAIFGPFQSAKVARELLRAIRHIVPFCTEKQRNGKQCFYTHLGLCDPCPSSIVTKEDTLRYRKNIFRIRAILSGKARRVIGQLEREMMIAAKGQQFEEAARMKKQIEALIRLGEKRLDPFLYTEKTTDDQLAHLQALLAPYLPRLASCSRIECIDISNISGRQATGSLVVLANGIPDTSQYRRFRIQTKRTPNDVAMVAEVLRRRLNHPEWPRPDLLVIDGGKPQVAAARSVTQEIPIIGLAKRFEEIIVCKENQFISLRLPLNNPAIHVLQRIRDEAHRFAKGYHTLLRRKLLAGLPSATIKPS